MKKNYMNPQVEVVIIAMEPILGGGSPDAGLTEEKVSIGDAESRDYDNWDD